MKKAIKYFVFLIIVLMISKFFLQNDIFAKKIKSNNSAVTTNKNTDFYYQEDADSDDTIIYTKIIDDKEYLFLPSQADYSSLKIKGNKHILKGKMDDAQIVMSDKLNEVGYDLTLLFGDMKSGIEYSLNVDEKIIYLFKSQNLSSLYIACDKTIAEINSSLDRSVKGKGTITKIEKNGDSSSSLLLNEIKGNEDWSWEKPGYNENSKKSYDILLNEKYSLSSGCKKAQVSWSLINDYGDDGATCDIGYKIYKELGAKYFFTRERTDLYVNGEYRGNYAILEKEYSSICDIKSPSYEIEGSNHSTEVIDKVSNPNDSSIIKGVQVYKYNSESVINNKNYGGFILECCYPNSLAEEGTGFILKSGMCFRIKEPKEPSKEQVKMVAEYFQEADDAINSSTGYNNLGKHYSQYYDLDQFVKVWLIKTFLFDNETLANNAHFSIDINSSHNLNGQKIISGPESIYDFFGSYDITNYERYMDLFSLEQLAFIKRNNSVGHIFSGSIYNATACYMNLFLTKGEFMKLVNDNVSYIIDKYTPEYINDYFNIYKSSKEMEKKAGYKSNNYGSSYNKSFNRFIENWEFRLDNFKYILEDSILGVEIKKDSKVLNSKVTNANLDNVNYQWYGIIIRKTNGIRIIDSIPINNANSSLLYLDSLNENYDAFQLYATSKNLAYLENNLAEVTNGYNFYPTITMHSNVLFNNYSVKFLNKNGDELGDFAQEVRYKADIVLPKIEDIPEIEGYKFIGWYGYEELADELESDVLLQTMYIKIPDIQSTGKNIEELDINIPGAEIVYTYYDLEGGVLEGPPSIPGTYRVEATIMLNGKELTKTSFDVEFKNTQIPNIHIYRLYNKVSGEHLFTSKVGEYNKLPSVGWVQEGRTFDAYAAGNKPEDAVAVYRLFNPMGFGGMGDHHYTKSQGEVNKLVKAGWSLDFNGQPAFYVAGKITVYKMYDKASGAHHYTPKAGEKKNMEKAGWVTEGVAWTVNGYYSNNGTQGTSDENM